MQKIHIRESYHIFSRFAKVRNKYNISKGLQKVHLREIVIIFVKVCTKKYIPEKQLSYVSRFAQVNLGPKSVNIFLKVCKSKSRTQNVLIYSQGLQKLHIGLYLLLESRVQCHSLFFACWLCYVQYHYDDPSMNLPMPHICAAPPARLLFMFFKYSLYII